MTNGAELTSLTLTTRAANPTRLEATITDLVDARVASKIAAQDPTLWGAEAQDEASIRLSWVGLAESSRPLVPRIEALRSELAAEGIDRVVLAGMGGSSLAPEVITSAAGVELVGLDTTDPGQVAAALTQLDRTVLVVSSKSGTTVETDSHRRIFEKAFTDAGLDAAAHIVVVTDPGSPMATLATQRGYRALFEADPHVGGRYSALTAFGLLPAGLAGADVGTLLDEAAAVAGDLESDRPENPALRLGALLGLAEQAGSEKVVLATPRDAAAEREHDAAYVGFGDWAEQLIAESTGKLGRGLLPVVVEGTGAPGFTDAGPDAVTVTIDGEVRPTAPESGFDASISGPLGAQLLTWEYAVAVAGRVIDINPFDQPDVESAKAAARAMLASPDKLSADAPAGAVTFGVVTADGPSTVISDVGHLTELLERFLALAPAAGYISIQAYLDRLADGAARLRPLVARKSGVQTTFGWGPRFLHSTGQYHKGGHPNGIFLQILGAATDDLAVPDRPYSLAQLQRAQARGDAAVLREHGRPVLTLTLADRGPGLDAIIAALA